MGVKIRAECFRDQTFFCLDSKFVASATFCESVDEIPCETGSFSRWALKTDSCHAKSSSNFCPGPRLSCEFSLNFNGELRRKANCCLYEQNIFRHCKHSLAIFKVTKRERSKTHSWTKFFGRLFGFDNNSVQEAS